MKTTTVLGLAIAVLLGSGVVGLAVVSEGDAGVLSALARRIEEQPAFIEAAGSSEITIPVHDGKITWEAFPNDTTALRFKRPDGVVAPWFDFSGIGEMIEGFHGALEGINAPPGAPRTPRTVPTLPSAPEPQPYPPPANGSPATVGLSLRAAGGHTGTVYSMGGSLDTEPGSVGLAEQSSPFSYYAGTPGADLGRDFGSGRWILGQPVDGPQAYLFLRPDMVPTLLRRASSIVETDGGFSFVIGAASGRVETTDRPPRTKVSVTAAGEWGRGLKWQTTSSVVFTHRDNARLPDLGREESGPGASIEFPANVLLHALSRPPEP